MFSLLAFQVNLVPDGTLLIHIALILVMIWVLNRTLFRPVNRIIAEREKNKGGHSGEAQEILRSVGEKQSRIEARMLEARSEGYELIERTRAAAVAERQAKIETVKRAVAELAEQENREIESQTKEARQAIAAQAEQMAERISQNILKSA